MANKGQFITAGMGQPVDINNQAIIESMKIYPGIIRNPWECLHKVRAAFHYFNKQEDKK